MPSGNSPRVILYDSEGNVPLQGSLAASGSIPVAIANDQIVQVSGTISVIPVAGVTGSITGSVGLSGPVAVSNFPAVQVVSGSNWIPTVTGSVSLSSAPQIASGSVTGLLVGGQPASMANAVPVTGSISVGGVVAISGALDVTGSVLVKNRVDVSGSAWTPTITGSITVINRVDVSGSNWIPTVTGSVTLAAAPLVLQGTSPWVVSGSSWVPTITGSVSINLGDAGRDFRPIHAEPTGGRVTILSGAIVSAASGTILTWQGWSEWYIIVNILGPIQGATPSITFTADQIDPIDRTTVITPRSLTAASGTMTGSGITVLELQDTLTDTFKVSWTVSGVNTAFSGVNVSWVGHAAGNSIEGEQTAGTTIHSDPIVVAGADSQGRAQYLQLDSSGRLVVAPNNVNATNAGFVFGAVDLTTQTLAVVEKTTYLEQLSGTQRSIVSTSGSDHWNSGSAQQVTITYYTVSGSGPKTEVINLSGTTAVNTVNTDICYIEKLEVTRAGAYTTNSGTISLKASVNGTGNTVGTIGGSAGQTFWCHHYIPSGSTCFITGLLGGKNNNTSQGAGGTFHIKATPLNQTTPISKQISDFVNNYGQANTVERTYGTPIAVIGPQKIAVWVFPDSALTTTYLSSIDFYENPT